MTRLPSEFDVHPASPEERLEIYRNVHDVWGGGRSLEEHVERRLASVSHQRAEWFAGVVDGRVVASLGCHPLEFRLRGRTIPGFAICAVHTVAAARGRGFAPQLITAVEEYQRAAGRRLALLYSDIGHDYYARVGYQAGPAHAGSLKTSGVSSPVRPKQVTSEVYREAYDRLTAKWPLVIARPDEYREHLFRREPNQTYHLVENRGECVGVFILAPSQEPSVRRLLEFVCRDSFEEHVCILCSAVVGAAAEAGVDTVVGWVPNVPGVQEVFEVELRDDELTMLKSLSDDVALDEELLRATDWFHEADHV